MVAHHPFRGVDIPAGDGVDHECVFVQSGLVGTLIPHSVVPGALQRPQVQAFGDVLGEAVAGQLHDREVEDNIRLPERVAFVAHLAHDVQGVLDAGQLFRGVPRGQRACHGGLEVGAHDRQLVQDAQGLVVVDERGQDDRVEHVPGPGACHLRSPALGHDNEALLLQPFDRFTDNRAADAEVVAERPFGGQQFALADLPGDDELDQFGHHRHAKSLGGTARRKGERVRSGAHAHTLATCGPGPRRLPARQSTPPAGRSRSWGMRRVGVPAVLGGGRRRIPLTRPSSNYGGS